MVDGGSSPVQQTPLARWIATITTVIVALLFALGTDSTDALLEKLWGSDFRLAVGILSRLWFYSTPAGAFIGILLGCLVLRSSWLTQSALRFLRIGRWAPFFLWWTLAAELTAAQQPIPLSWFGTYGAVAVALAAWYEFLALRFVLRLPLRAALGGLVRPVIIHGILIALVLDMSVSAELWFVYPGKTPISYAVSIALAAIILLIHRASGHTFDQAAADRGAILVEELKYDNWSSLWGAAALIVTCFVAWQARAGLEFSTSPIEVLVALRASASGGELLGDISVSLAEIVVGLVLSGGVAAFLVFVSGRAARLKGLLQLAQVAPIALLPDIFGLFQMSLYKWSIACAAVFCFYPFARALWGLRSETILCRTLLALDEALPYGAAAIVYGEAMNATGGLGFMIVVAGATSQTAKGLAGFLTLLLLVATLSTLLRWLANGAYYSALSTGKN